LQQKPQLQNICCQRAGQRHDGFHRQAKTCLYFGRTQLKSLTAINDTNSATFIQHAHQADTDTTNIAEADEPTSIRPERMVGDKRSDTRSI
ncbi:hypothetical protein TSAR_002740, partial [Trichomalopsis sarcophagae]